MNFNQLQYFLNTCRYGSISIAAKKLHVSQSTISKSIRKLEEELELKLFNRHKNKLLLTEEGKSILKNSSQILEHVDALYANVRDIKNSSNIIKIGMTPLVGGCFLPPFYQELKDFDNLIVLDIFELNYLTLLQSLEEGSIDFGLIICNKLDTSKFKMVYLLDVSLVFCTNVNNPLSKKEIISITDLIDEPLVLVTPDSIENKLLTDRFLSKCIEPNIIFISNHIYTIQHLINHEIVSTFLYDIIVPRNNEIKQIPLSEDINLTIGLVWKKDKYLYSGMKKTIKFAKSFKFKYYHG